MMLGRRFFCPISIEFDRYALPTCSGTTVYVLKEMPIEMPMEMLAECFTGVYQMVSAERFLPDLTSIRRLLRRSVYRKEP